MASRLVHLDVLVLAEVVSFGIMLGLIGIHLCLTICLSHTGLLLVFELLRLLKLTFFLVLRFGFLLAIMLPRGRTCVCEGHVLLFIKVKKVLGLGLSKLEYKKRKIKLIKLTCEQREQGDLRQEHACLRLCGQENDWFAPQFGRSYCLQSSWSWLCN
ncbi:hypothetical protein BCR41DRAFT_171220 [Lobosporangium transversale]|uniref:Uncharacterized protein n=1 Tax=Lobosporangium transversale TaxID=64571 RepID=A0A1Y2GB69_9FUNG|nr:hypothetical protein BCR41DRAFT_171220 [Lobosporangium transversale]ORZ06120.1 hypothetical protein BCR41DRAFT_171220 [Lobosporangium transversale]|eukprot:XP_021877389.1 hypothetical protein BCR41DRAFT_171220 [Lobosporangium transversale]